MTQVKIEDKLFEASISGRTKDSAWDDRASKAITMEMTHAEAVELFVDGAAWSIVTTNLVNEPKLDEAGNPVLDENGDPITGVVEKVEEYDNSDCCVAGDITDHRDGTVTCKMGKLTDLEETLALVYGGEL